MGMMLNRRRVMGGKSLPYDAEIEYLRGTGTQYIDSGIECTGDLSVKCKVRMSTNENKSMLGGIYDYGSTYFRHHLNNNYNQFYWLQNDKIDRANIIYTTPVNTWLTIDIDASSGTYTINGTIGTFEPVLGSVTTHANYGIFGRLSGNLATQIRTGNNDIAYIQLPRNGVLLRDYIPVRVGTVGYLYDKVSGKLFGIVGTDDFILGPDKDSVL